MKQFWLLFIVLGGSFGLAFLATMTIDRGPFERAAVGIESIYWEASKTEPTSPGLRPAAARSAVPAAALDAELR